MSYDGIGNERSDTNPNGSTTSFSYDHLNRQTLITNALGFLTTMSYDAAGNLLE
jgi:YD repeat-containing protein